MIFSAILSATTSYLTHDLSDLSPMLFFYTYFKSFQCVFVSVCVCVCGRGFCLTVSINVANIYSQPGSVEY